jgi:hypothetical protein
MEPGARTNGTVGQLEEFVMFFLADVSAIVRGAPRAERLI